MKNKSLLQYIFLFLFILLISNLNISKAQTLEGGNDECILCTQVVPDCKENERLVNQTCKQCAHCEPIDSVSPSPTPNPTPSESTNNCQKCLIHAECMRHFICVNECCIENPKREKKIITACKKRCSSNKQCDKSEFCRNHCCILKPTPTPKPQIKRSQTKKPVYEHKKTEIKTKTESKPLTKDTHCENPCGTKCCKAGHKCITIDQCKGKKKPCKLPTLRYCSKKTPDPLSGRLSTFE